MLKKVLIITYYWPPGGGAGVQRWLKFAKYLPEFGWQPIIYTPSNGEMPVLDYSLEKDIPSAALVWKQPIWEPYAIYKRFVGAKKEEKINTGFLTEEKKPGTLQRIAVWIRGNLFIPDARCFWIKPSVKYLNNQLNDLQVDAIVSTGPPHSMHLIAMEVAKSKQLPWLADFRDPWTNIDYYKDLMLSESADKKHHKLEQQVLQNANRVVAVGKTMGKEFEAISGRKIDVITNGFDEEDVASPFEKQSDRFIIAHIGTLVKTRNPEILWKAVKELSEQLPEFKKGLLIKLTGKSDISIRNAVSAAGLETSVQYGEYLPHEAVVKEQQNASLLLLMLNNTPNAKGILTGKLFEYMASGTPVLAIGPSDGDAAEIIKETACGECFDFGDLQGVKTYIRKQFEAWQHRIVIPRAHAIDKYSRKSLTASLATILNEMTK